MSEAGPAAPPPKNKPAAARFKPGLHPRNRDLAGYDFPALATASPGLMRYLVTTPAGSTLAMALRTSSSTDSCIPAVCQQSG